MTEQRKTGGRHGYYTVSQQSSPRVALPMPILMALKIMTGDETLTKRDRRPTKKEQQAAQAADREPDEPNLSEDDRKEILQFAERNRNRRRAAKLQVI